MIEQVGYCHEEAVVPFVFTTSKGMYKDLSYEAEGYRNWQNGELKFITHVIGQMESRGTLSQC